MVITGIENVQSQYSDEVNGIGTPERFWLMDDPTTKRALRSEGNQNSN
jgi:hypothetical protein